MKRSKYPGWYRYVLLCNDMPIMSSDNLPKMEGEAGNRQGRYPRNNYRVEDNFAA